MDLMKILPWALSGVLSVICWQQDITISLLEKEKVALSKEIISASPKVRKNGGLQKTKLSETSSVFQDIRMNQKEKRDSFQWQDRKGEKTSLSDEDIDVLVEERAWERVEEIEENRREEKMERISERIQERISGWAEEFDWSEEVQTQMAEVMITHMRERFAMHEKMRNGEVDREEMQESREAIETERKEQIIELIGEEQFEALEEELRPRRPRR